MIVAGALFRHRPDPSARPGGGEYHVVIDFGAIGSGLPAAIGVAAAEGDGKVLLIEGDGSIMLHIQELETIRRHGIELLICVLNDGGYGAEIHKFRAYGIDPSTRSTAAAISRPWRRASACAAPRSTRRAASRPVPRAPGGHGATLWDVHIDDLIVSRQYRRVHYGEA